MVSADAGAERYREPHRRHTGRNLRRHTGRNLFLSLLVGTGFGAAGVAAVNNEGVRDRALEIFQPQEQPRVESVAQLNASLFHDGGLPVSYGRDNLPYSTELMMQLRQNPDIAGRIPANAQGARYITRASYGILRADRTTMTITDPNRVGQLAVHSADSRTERVQIDD